MFPGALVTTGVLRDLPSFQFRKDDVVVASFPKAGVFSFSPFLLSPFCYHYSFISSTINYCAFVMILSLPLSLSDIHT